MRPRSVERALGDCSLVFGVDRRWLNGRSCVTVNGRMG